MKRHRCMRDEESKEEDCRAGSSTAGLTIKDVIVADGGSTDRTAEIARREGAKVVRAARGRSSQLNEGAKLASGDVFLFLHGDCRLPDDWKNDMDKLLDRVMKKSQRQEKSNIDVQEYSSPRPPCWGAFSDVRITAVPLRVDKHPNMMRRLYSSFMSAQLHFSLAIMELGVKLRTELHSLPYGDQGIWMTRDIFE